ncbi:MAG TPA: DUF2202 domain-containing protein [Bacilli bacterium]|nr:DUF2202 domain-containing protein [Bacilli bacterium]
MKNKKTIISIVIVLIVLIIIGALVYLYYNNNKNENIKYNINMEPTPLSETESTVSSEGYGATGALEDSNLTILDMLTYAVQDEYLAHGEYEAIIEKFGNQRPYTNIILSEETHLSYLKEIYESYNLSFPEDESNSHIVVPETLLEAAETGVKAEEDNIAMYEKFLTYNLPESVKDVFTILRDGSENHLKAFQNQVNKLS